MESPDGRPIDGPTPDPIESLVRALRSAMATSPQLRQAAHHLGQWLIEIAARDAQAPAHDAPTATTASDARAASVEPAPVIHQPRPIRGPTEVVISPEAAAAALRRGLGAEAVSPRRPDSPVIAGASGIMSDGAVALPVPRIDFNLIHQRCRLKVAACDFARRHDEHHAAGGTFDQLRTEYDALITRGKSLSDCYLWMVNPRSLVKDADQLAEIRACYQNLADAAAMMIELSESHGEGQWPEEALWLLAEAQSALYVSLRSSPWQHPDPDQLHVYGFVRDEARRRRIFMDQFLSEDAPADPGAAGDLSEHLRKAREEWRAERKVIKARREALRKVEYEARQLASCLPDDRAIHAQKIEAGVRGFIEAGGTVDSAALAELVIPVREVLDGLLAADSEVWSVRAPERPSLPQQESEAADDRPMAPAPEVLRARELLRGRVMLLIGGEERPQHARRLEESLELRELRWSPHREHTSLAPLESEIARPEVDLVLLPIRWNGTETGPTIRQWCKTYGKPCVTLKAGYNANQIAHAVLEQVSERLAAAG